MAFPAELLRAGIAIADTLTKGVQVDVTLEAWTGQSGFGVESFASPVTIKCVLDLTRKQIKTDSGREITIVATLTKVGDVAPNGTAGRREPIDPRDRITLPDGTTGPIIDVPGAVVDPGTGRGFINAIMIGAL